MNNKDIDTFRAVIDRLNAKPRVIDCWSNKDIIEDYKDIKEKLSSTNVNSTNVDHIDEKNLEILWNEIVFRGLESCVQK
jgi:DNA-binding transcriptional regulator GbsR (MarR family)